MAIVELRVGSTSRLTVTVPCLGMALGVLRSSVLVVGNNSSPLPSVGVGLGVRTGLEIVSKVLGVTLTLNTSELEVSSMLEELNATSELEVESATRTLLSVGVGLRLKVKLGGCSVSEIAALGVAKKLTDFSLSEPASEEAEDMSSPLPTSVIVGLTVGVLLMGRLVGCSTSEITVELGKAKLEVKNRLLPLSRVGVGLIVETEGCSLSGVMLKLTAMLRVCSTSRLLGVVIGVVATIFMSDMRSPLEVENAASSPLPSVGVGVSDDVVSVWTEVIVRTSGSTLREDVGSVLTLDGDGIVKLSLLLKEMEVEGTEMALTLELITTSDGKMEETVGVGTMSKGVSLTRIADDATPTAEVRLTVT